MRNFRLLILPLIAAFSVSACGGSEGGADADPISIVTPIPDVSDGADARNGTGEEVERKWLFGRSSMLYEPRNISGKAPLMVVLHPGFSNVSMFTTHIDARPLADAQRFRILAPRAAWGNWNSGAEGSSNDDVGFIMDEIASLIVEGKADPDRIWLVGMSSGAMMGHRLLCEASELFSAAFFVAGTATDEFESGQKAYGCTAPKAVPIMAINGLSDTCVPYHGGVGTGFRKDVRRPVYDVMLEWADRHQCASIGYAAKTTGVSCDVYTDCGPSEAKLEGMSVTSCRVDHGGHNWPGARSDLFQGQCGGELHDWSATQAMWSFLSQH